MRQAAATLESFYRTPLGQAAAARMSQRLQDLWPSCQDRLVLGVGFAAPILSVWQAEARACISLQPEEAGAAPFSSTRGGAAVLAPEDRFPFAEESFERIILLHALEESNNPRAVMREAWRVLAPEGRIVIAVPNRRSLWSLSDTKAFGHGRAWSRRQLIQFATDNLFQVTASTTAIHMPPLNWSMITGPSPAWERVGDAILPGLGGVVLVEAVKRLYAKPSGSAGAAVTDLARQGQGARAMPRNQAAKSATNPTQNQRIDAAVKGDTPLD